MSNRVDDLEEHIAELRAAVNGLTEELVETKARVKQLEADAEAEAEAATEANAAEPVSGTVETTTKSDDHVEVVEHERQDAGSAGADTAPDTPSAADDTAADSSADTDETDADADADQPDIIVA